MDIARISENREVQIAFVGWHEDIDSTFMGRIPIMPSRKYEEVEFSFGGKQGKLGLPEWESLEIYVPQKSEFGQKLANYMNMERLSRYKNRPPNIKNYDISNAAKTGIRVNYGDIWIRNCVLDNIKHSNTYDYGVEWHIIVNFSDMEFERYNGEDEE